MIISKLILKNWRNFSNVDVSLSERVFLVGPNASGKSNLLDVFRFLRDIATQGGGLQKAVSDRGGVSKIRCLYARRNPDIEIEVEFSEESGAPEQWRYAVGIRQEPRGQRLTYLSHERVLRNGRVILDRPDNNDKEDRILLTQTHLEQVGANKDFREIYHFLNSILYLHLIPQLLRFPDAFHGVEMPGDPFGRNFLERVSATSKQIKKSRLSKIEDALQSAVPNLKQLNDIRDDKGNPHLEAVYEHWRPQGAKQREDQFSDGTLRLIALFWSFLEGQAPLLLEEPELSLNAAIVSKIPALMHRMQRKKKGKRQIILSTHSADLLSDRGIGGEEVLLLRPGIEGTEVRSADTMTEIKTLLDSGLSVADVVLPHANPPEVHQLELFEF